MKTRFLSMWAIMALTCIGCSTPPQVKQLSLMQLEYLDAAITAVDLQSEALLIAVERLGGDARKKIDIVEKEDLARFETLLQGTLSADQAKETLARISTTMQAAAAARAKLDTDQADIMAKTSDLKAYLRKLKEVHIALDAYVQSEKAGEGVLNDLLNSPSVKALLNSVNQLMPKVQSGVGELDTLLRGLSN